MSKIPDLFGRNRLCYRLYFKKISLRQILHIIKALLIRIFFKKKYPLSVTLGLTYNCQCKCSHCGISQERFNSINRILSFLEVKELITELVDLGVIHIAFSGGEPTLRKDIFEIIKFAVHKGLIISLNSNGFSLSREYIKKLKQLGLSLLKISLDSSNPDIHDEIRGIKGCFDNAVRAMKYSITEKLPCIIGTVVTKEIVENRDLQNIVNLAKNIRVSGVKIEFAAYAGELLKKKYQVLSREDIEYVKNICDLRYIFYSSFLSDFSKCSCLSKLNCYISPAGDVQVCVFLPLKFGNVRENSFKNIWQKMYLHPIYKFAPQDCYGENDFFRKKYFASGNVNSLYNEYQF